VEPAADILLYSPDIVPVGKDQKQHIEYARDIAGKFNNQYGELFKLPNGLILEEVEIVPGTDGQKMSKSYGNTIPLFGTDEEIQKAVMSIATDSRGKDEEKNPDDMVLYQIHKLFNNSAELKAQYTQGLGYGDAKKMLIADIISFVTPMRERRKKYEDDPKLVEEILLQGAIKANDVAMKKLGEVYEAVGLTQ
jgi:tryptophanyl-tRNA synthetase